MGGGGLTTQGCDSDSWRSQSKPVGLALPSLRTVAPLGQGDWLECNSSPLGIRQACVDLSGFLVFQDAKTWCLKHTVQSNKCHRRKDGIRLQRKETKTFQISPSCPAPDSPQSHQICCPSIPEATSCLQDSDWWWNFYSPQSWRAGDAVECLLLFKLGSTFSFCPPLLCPWTV